MNKYLKIILLFSLAILIMVTFLNINVSMRQGVNYRVQILQIPLYLKLLDFFDRHYNYTLLVKRIINDSDSEESRIMKIFNWTYANLRKTPNGFPVIDDHVWHVVVRGYGEPDQYCDVFSTLCNYAGVESFFVWISTPDGDKKLPLSFVRVGKTWTIFDPFRKTRFLDKNGVLADVVTLRSEEWRIDSPESTVPDYKAYFTNLPDFDHVYLTRPTVQSPVNRFLFWLQQLFNRGAKRSSKINLP